MTAPDDQDDNFAVDQFPGAEQFFDDDLDPGYPYGDSCVHCDGVGCRYCGYGGI